MDTVRFSLMALVMFAFAFIGISWSQKSLPVVAIEAEPMKPDARTPAFEKNANQGIRKDWENSKTAQSDGDKARDQLRIELMQASIGYKLSPCDATMKRNLVSAVTNYTKAWHAKLNCQPGVDGCPVKEDERFEAARGAFKTPADVRVHRELREAYELGGVTKADFPDIGRDAFLFSGMPFGDPQAGCITRQAENRR
jgi:hypothetical protein